MKKYLILLASGKGTRFGGDCPKQFLKIRGRMLLEYTLEAGDCGLFDEIILVVSSVYVDEMKALVAGVHYQTPIRVESGGDSRYESCKAGIASLHDDEAFVVIHNAVQPFVSKDTFRKCLEALEHHAVVTAGTPCVYTILETDANGLIVRQPPRNLCYEDMGPECFRLSALRKTFEIGDERGMTNLTGIALKHGISEVAVVEGNSANRKITYPEDVAMAERIIAKTHRVSSPDSYGLSPLWEALLDLYGEFRKVCDAHGLRHYVIGGTLLGAIRHKGFIPWDDDFDLAMPRQDYEKLIALPQEELPGHLRLMNRFNTPAYKTHFSKFMDCRKSRILEIERKIGHQLSNGLFLDVFPIDGYPASVIGRTICRLTELKNHIVTSRKDYLLTGKKLTLIQRVVKFAGFLLSPFAADVVDEDRFLEVSATYLRKREYRDDQPAGMGGYRVGRFQMTFPPKTFGRGVELPFEDIKVSAPDQWRKFLEINYGAHYMDLPPEDKRQCTHEYGERMPWCFGPTN